MSKFLIVNADDYGITNSITDGILEGLESGFISDVSVLANSENFELATDRLKKAGIDSCGVHLCFIDKEEPLKPAPNLILENGHFLINRNTFLKRFLFNRKLIISYLWEELDAQIARVLSKGLQVTHLDSHQHLHIFPGIDEVVVGLAVKYNISHIRVPRYDGFSLIRVPVNLFCLHLQSRMQAEKKLCTQMLGFKNSGRLTKEAIDLYIQQIKKSKNRFFEIMTHPGIADIKTREKYAHWNYTWDEELKFLSLLTKDYLQENRIQLISFKSLMVNHELSALQK